MCTKTKAEPLPQLLWSKPRPTLVLGWPQGCTCLRIGSRTTTTTSAGWFDLGNWTGRSDGDSLGQYELHQAHWNKNAEKKDGFEEQHYRLGKRKAHFRTSCSGSSAQYLPPLVHISPQGRVPSLDKRRSKRRMQKSNHQTARFLTAEIACHDQIVGSEFDCISKSLPKATRAFLLRIFSGKWSSSPALLLGRRPWSLRYRPRHQS